MQTEENVIQKALKENRAEIFDRLPYPKMFLNPHHQHIWKLAMLVRSQDIPATFESVHTAINQENHKLKDSLHSTLTKIQNEVYWYDESKLDEIKDGWMCRVYQNHGKKLLEAGTDKLPLVEANEDITRMYNLIKDTTEEKKIFISLDSVRDDILNRVPEKLSDYRLMVPGQQLKWIFGDYMLPRLYIVAGLPSMGKNVLVDLLVSSLLVTGNKGIYFSFDNSAMETGYMMQHILTKIPYPVIETGILDEYQRKQVQNTERISKRLYITSKRMNVDKMRIHLEKLKADDYWGDFRYIVLDYFQNIPRRPGMRSSEVAEYEYAAVQLNQMCTDMGITAIVLSQSRDRDRNDSVKFSLNDLKWCGGLGEAAFYVVGIEGERNTVFRDIKIAKNKRGQLGTKTFEFDFSKKEIRDNE